MRLFLNPTYQAEGKNMEINKLKETVRKEIENNYDEAIKILSRLVEFKSTSGNELEAQNYIGTVFDKWGFKTDFWEPELSDLKRLPGFLTNRSSFSEVPILQGFLREETAVNR